MQAPGVTGEWYGGMPSPERWARPNWLAGTDKLQLYSEWFVWARRRVADPDACHRAALAATGGLERGQGWDAALEAGRLAATDPHPRPLPRIDPAVRGYVTWFAFATYDLDLAPAAAHVAAAAANSAQLLGAPSDQAAHIGMRAAGLPAPEPVWRPGTAPRPAAGPPTYQAADKVHRFGRATAAPAGRTGVLSDPAMGLLIVAIACAAIPVASILFMPQNTVYLRFTPAFGILNCVRSIGRGRLWMMGAALALDVFALGFGLTHS